MTRTREAAPAEGLKRRYPLDSASFLGPAMLLPAVLYITALVAFPLVLAIAYSFSDVTIGNQSIDWVGLRNFRAVWRDPVFQEALRNTVLFTVVSQVLVVVLAKILALALARDFRGKWFFRFLILLPWTTPIALGAIAWLWMLDSIFSPIDWMLREAGLLGPHTLLGPANNLFWLGKSDLARLSVVVVHVWRMLPLATVIILAGLTSIPKDLRDAAAVDGAGFWRELFQITIPLTLPIIAVALLFGVVFTFTDITAVYVLTRGGPVNSTQVLATWSFFRGIQGGDLAQGAAIALFFFPVLVAVAVVVLRLARRLEVH